MKLQDLPKEKLIEIIISTNKKRDRLGKKWHKVACHTGSVPCVPDIGDMTNEEREEAARYLRNRVVDEMLKLEDFRKNVTRKFNRGGKLRIEHSDGSVSEYAIRKVDDLQDVLDFVQTLCHKRTKDLQERLNNLK